MTEVVDGERRIVNDPRSSNRSSTCSPRPGRRIKQFIVEQLTPTRPRCRAVARSLAERYGYVDGAQGGRGRQCRLPRLHRAAHGTRPERPADVNAIAGGAQSVLEPFSGPARSCRKPGRRVVEGQRILQATSDVLLGWTDTEASTVSRGRSTFVNSGTTRPLQTSKASRPKPCACTLSFAAGHFARAPCSLRDPIAISSYPGSGDNFDLVRW
ncbi:MAG: DUF2252 family protein [Candidatus Microthrix sp.]|nr:DUF2252 family protein [Candidatus Microthrix sp.]